MCLCICVCLPVLLTLSGYYRCWHGLMTLHLAVQRKHWIENAEDVKWAATAVYVRVSRLRSPNIFGSYFSPSCRFYGIRSSICLCSRWNCKSIFTMTKRCGTERRRNLKNTCISLMSQTCFSSLSLWQCCCRRCSRGLVLLGLWTVNVRPFCKRPQVSSKHGPFWRAHLYVAISCAEMKKHSVRVHMLWRLLRD